MTKRKYIVNFYYRPLTKETFSLSTSHVCFNPSEDAAAEEEDSIIHDLIDGLWDRKAGLLRVSAVAEVVYSRDYYGEVDVEYHYEFLEVTEPESWSELRYVWGSILMTEGLLSEKERHYFFKNIGNRLMLGEGQ